MAGKIGHDPLFLPVEPGIFRIPASLVENPPSISFCEYEMRSVVVREVISDWYDDTTGKVTSYIIRFIQRMYIVRYLKDFMLI